MENGSAKIVVKLNIQNIQNILQKSILRNVICLGIDIATQKSGWALITTTSRTLTIKTGTLTLKDDDIWIRFDKSIAYFDKLIKSNQIVVIENSFLKFNIQVFGKLSKIEGMIYAVAKLKPCKKIIILGPSQARKNLGIMGNCQKEDIKQWLQDKLKLKIENEDVADSIILALNGVLK